MAVGKKARLSRLVGSAGKVSGKGEQEVWTASDRKAVADAVDTAEKHCGIQIMVFVGRSARDPHSQAISMLQQGGYSTVPGILFLVDPDKHHVEMVTSEQAKARVTDENCDEVIALMIPYFRDRHLAKGLSVGIDRVSEIAGQAKESGEELPDVID